jgi:elongator complex protein 6
MASRTPPLLEPYLYLPHETSLILLTGVLGSSTNWLVHRYLHSLLVSQSSFPTSHPSYSSYSSPLHSSHRKDELDESPDVGLIQQQQHVSVVLVSFLRDYAFWKDGCKRLGLDLDLAKKKGSVVFVDGLTKLFMPPSDHGGGRGQPLIGLDASGNSVLSAATTDHLRQAVEKAVAHVQGLNPGTRTVLVMDQPDVLLAVAGDAMSSQGLRDAILGLREVSSSRARILFDSLRTRRMADINESCVIESTCMHRHCFCR